MFRFKPSYGVSLKSYSEVRPDEQHNFLAEASPRHAQTTPGPPKLRPQSPHGRPWMPLIPPRPHKYQAGLLDCLIQGVP